MSDANPCAVPVHDAVTLGALLDEVASFVFAGEQGAARLAPLLEAWAEEVGTIREDDEQRELLQAMRADWALCDVPTDDGRPWLARALDGEFGPVADPWRVLARNHVGLFEVFPGKVSWLRDLRAGLSAPVLDPLPLLPEVSGPAALWEVRVVLLEGTAVLARAPLAYPMEILEQVLQRSRTRFGSVAPKLRWTALRRGWLQNSRARRADPRIMFRL